MRGSTTVQDARLSEVSLVVGANEPSTYEHSIYHLIRHKDLSIFFLSLIGGEMAHLGLQA